MGNDEIKNAFAEHLCFVQRVMQFELFAWVIMPEHIHLLLRPAIALNPHTPPSGMVCGTPCEPAQSVTEILRRLKAPFGRRVLSRWRELDAPILSRILDHRNLPRFWQPGGGYDRNIFSDEELLEKIYYTHDNPVRRGLVEHALDYRCSSALYYEYEASYVGPAIAQIA